MQDHNTRHSPASQQEGKGPQEAADSGRRTETCTVLCQGERSWNAASRSLDASARSGRSPDEKHSPPDEERGGRGSTCSGLRQEKGEKWIGKSGKENERRAGRGRWKVSVEGGREEKKKNLTEGASPSAGSTELPRASQLA